MVITYKDGEWPEVVVLFLTWAGPPARKIAKDRLRYAKLTIQGLRKHLHYPNLSWHIADDGSPKGYQEKIKALFGKTPYTFSDTKKGWDINNNWNRGAKVAFGRADLLICWPDDRFLKFDLNLKPFVQLLMSCREFCGIRLRPRPGGMVSTPTERVGQKWWRIDKKTSRCREVTSYFEMRHRRYIDYYGYLPTGFWPVIRADTMMNTVFRRTPGPDVVIPDIIQARVETPWGAISTWESAPNAGTAYRKTAPPWKTKADKMVIVGPTKLRGEIKVGGAKNAALPILAAALLTKEKVHLERVPDLTDVKVQMQLLQKAGAKIRRKAGTVMIDAAGTLNPVVPADLGRQIRYSLLMLSMLLSRCGKAVVPLPGGCNIGNRKFDMHLDGLRAMGASISVDKDAIQAEASQGLTGAEIELYYPTVSGTMNLMMAASLADGVTTIENAATDPEVVNVAWFLHKMGAKIRGIGTRTLTIEGNKALHGCKHTILADRFETLTFLIAGAITQSTVVVDGCPAGHLTEELAVLRAAGATIEIMKQDGPDYPEQKFRVIGSKRLRPVSIATTAYPGFHTDSQPLFTVLMVLANGQSTIKEAIMENRFSHLGELEKMGAKIEIQEGDFTCPNGAQGKIAVIDGVEKLYGARVHCHDLRAGAALLLATLVADGETILENVAVIDRGYEHIDDKLLSLGTYASRQC